MAVPAMDGTMRASYLMMMIMRVRSMKWTPELGPWIAEVKVIAPAFVLQIKQLPAAAFAPAVGMWATRLRCPSEAAYPQSSSPRSYPCRHAMPPWETGCSSPDAGGDGCKSSSMIRCRLALRARQHRLSDALPRI